MYTNPESEAGWRKTSDECTITGLTSTIVDIPLLRTYEFLGVSRSTQTLLIVQLFTDQGIVGLGECAVPLDRPADGVLENAKAALDIALGPAVTGLPTSHAAGLYTAMDQACIGASLAKAAVECAAQDAWARYLGVSVGTLLGGTWQESAPVTWLLTDGSAAHCAEEAIIVHEAVGHTSATVRIPATDEAVNWACEIARRLDGRATLHVNIWGAQDEELAVARAVKLAESGVALIEQPMAPETWATLRILSKKLPVIVSADDEHTTMSDATRIASTLAADSMAIHPSKSGGLRQARTIMEMSQGCGLECRIGTCFDGQIGTAAALQLACSVDDVPFGTDLFGPTLMAESLVLDPLRYEDGRVNLPAGPGLGITLDTQALKSFARC